VFEVPPGNSDPVDNRGAGKYLCNVQGTGLLRS
jgi:hypothetical protein